MDQPPSDQELRNIIDKLAQFVARNGAEFEHMTKQKQKNNPKFSFLFGGEHYHYYTYKVNAEQAILRQKGISANSGPQMPHNYNQPPPGMGGPGGGWRGPPPFRGPGPHMSGPRPPRMGEPPPSHHWGTPPPTILGKPRPLMDIHTYAPAHEDDDCGVNPDILEIGKLKEEMAAAEKQISTMKLQIKQSEQNLAAQKKVTDGQVQELTEQTVRMSRLEYLQLLSSDIGMSLEEVDIMLQPIVESCTKETIGMGKVWIFQNATTHDKNRLLAHYLAYKVTEPTASFQLKLHLIYLMNDVLHHCVRKNNEELKGSLESVAVEMFCSAWISSASQPDAASRQGKLTKLIKLWQDKSIFSQSTLNKMKNIDEAWDLCKNQLELDYQHAIKEETKHLIDTYISYSAQHDAFVAHAEGQIKSFALKIDGLKEKIAEQQTWVSSLAPTAPPVADTSTQPAKKSRWDTGSDGKAVPHHNEFPSSLALPDFSRPPPGFGGPPPPINAVIPQNRPPPFNESSLIPTLPYYDLPAGLMVPLIKLEDSGYKPINPKDLRLPPPNPPTERLLMALEQFYAPPSHDRPRDPEGWEMLGLYEWSRAKTSAIKRKADDIEGGLRERSPTASPSPYSDDEVAQPAKDNSPKQRARKRYRSRSRSRTRSRSRGSTPDDRRVNRSPSPEGGYSLPSYLTKKSPSPDRGSPQRSRDQKRSFRRSPTPPESSFKGFGGSSSKQLDSSNKGHQMMQKMGWKGSGLGTSEEGIVEPVSGGEVRDKHDLYRGIGHAADPFENFRKSKAGSFYTRMKDRDHTRKQPKK